MATNKRKILRQQRDIGITEREREFFLEFGWGYLGDLAAERQVELWGAYQDVLLAEYCERNGMFCRPAYWWINDAPEPRKNESDDTETQKAYFLRHPELQTPEEKSWLKTHRFSRWELMPVSEVEDVGYFRQHRELLTPAEDAALLEHLANE
jgi:hypothetical protein